LIVGRCRCLLSERRLPLQQRVDLLLDPALVKKLLVRGVVELCAQVSNSLLIASLHVSHRAADVTPRREISSRTNRPYCRDDKH
jgi:hypothetical protein